MQLLVFMYSRLGCLLQDLSDLQFLRASALAGTASDAKLGLVDPFGTAKQTSVDRLDQIGNGQMTGAYLKTVSAGGAGVGGDLTHGRAHLHKSLEIL